MNSFFSSKLNQVLGTIVLLGVILALGSYAYMTMKNAGWMGQTTINVIGNGEVTAVPDIATFSFSVKAEGKDAAEAQTKSAEIMNKALGFLGEEGVAETDIKTTGYNLSPKYSYEQAPCAVGMYCPPTDPKQIGFEIYQTVTVKVRDTNKAGTLLSGVGERGATDMSSLGFTIDDEDDLKSEARKLAIADAKAQAEALAAQLGVKLGKMTSYYEDAPYSPMPYYAQGGMDRMVAAEAKNTVPEVPTGENTITSRVNLTYEIK